MSYRVRLTRVENDGTLGPDAPRTNVIEGSAPELPTVGERFLVIGKALDPRFDARGWSTSVVQRVELPLFFTENSTYHLTVY